jgi:hypothetical protein
LQKLYSSHEQWRARANPAPRKALLPAHKQADLLGWVLAPLRSTLGRRRHWRASDLLNRTERTIFLIVPKRPRSVHSS